MSALIDTAVSSISAIYPGGTSSASAISVPGTVTAGDFIIGIGFSENPNRDFVSATGTGATTYGLLTGGNPRGDAGCVQIAWGVAADSNGGKGYYMDLTGNSGDGGMLALIRVSGLDATQANLSQNQSVMLGTPNVSGNVTPFNATGFAVCAQLRTGSSWTDDAAWTEIVTGDDRYYLAYRVNPPASAFQVSNVEGSGARDSSTRIVAFHGTAGGGPTIILMGQACL